MGLQVTKPSVVALSKATTASCGAKASACAQLAKLARESKKKGGFGTAEGVCLPFGCMEAVIQVSLMPDAVALPSHNDTPHTQASLLSPQLLACLHTQRYTGFMHVFGVLLFQALL